MGAQLCAVQVLDFVGIRDEVAILRLEVHSLVEIHSLVIPLVIPSFIQALPRPPPLIFNLFIEDDEAPPIGDKRGCEEE